VTIQGRRTKASEKLSSQVSLPLALLQMYGKLVRIARSDFLTKSKAVDMVTKAEGDEEVSEG
jgi:hypothetical protein